MQTTNMYLTHYKNWSKYYETSIPNHVKVSGKTKCPISGFNWDTMARATATFQCLADVRQLKVYRYSGFVNDDYRCEWYHHIEILDMKGGIVASLGGYVIDTDVMIGKWDKLYVEKTEIVDKDHIKIPILIGTEKMPNIPDFWDENGDPFDFTDDFHGETFQALTITMNRNDVIDKFK